MRPLAALFPLLAIAGCGGLLGGTEDPPGGRNSDDEVRALLRSSVAALDDHELNRFMGQFGADVRVHTPAGRLNGYAAVREHLAGLLEATPDLSISIDSVRARRTGDEIVVVEYVWRADGAGIRHEGIGSSVYVLRGADWEMVLAYVSIRPPRTM